MKRLAFLLIALSPVSAAQNYATSFKSTEVADGFYMLDGADGFGGGNVGLLVGDEYIVLIDDALVPTAPALLEAALELTGRPIDFVINTHVHGDHVGGNELMSENDAIIVAHDNIRKRMQGDPKLDTGPGALPVLTFSDAVTFHINGDEAFVFHIENAHTDGDAAILFRNSNVIFAGDILFNGLFPYIDLDNGGSVEGYIAGQRRLLAMANDATRIVAGHGPIASKSDLQRNLDVLIAAQSLVRPLVESGMDADEIVAANPLAPHESYSWRFITTERMTRTLVRSLTSE